MALKTQSLIFLFLLVAHVTIAQTYIWNGSVSDDFTLAANWTPARVVTQPTDNLLFEAGSEIVVTGLIDEVVGKISVTDSTTLAFSAVIVNKVLTIANTPGTDLLVEPGSSLVFKNNGGVKIDVEMEEGTTAEIGGNILMEKGTFHFNNAAVTFHTSTDPLNVIAGAFTFGAGSDLTFGKLGETSTDQMIIGDNIFATAPAISNLTINRTGGVRLGNQPITINNSASFLEGDLVTNNLGRIVFSSLATNPLETTSSKIIGFAEMSARSLNSSAMSFLGFSIASGTDDLGNVTLVRMTGPSGIRFSSSHESIAATWDVNVENQPINGREIFIEWLSEFDNGNDINAPMQMYRFTTGDSWQDIGGANEIAASVDGLRTSATVLTTHFSEWTMSSTDNALPVSLVYFNGKAQNGHVALEWSTATELNNDRFIVERKIGGEFVFVGSVKGKGTSTEVNTYQFTDTQPQSGNNYYRLVQQDFDGQRTTFDPILVQVATNFKVYPNPTSGDNLSVVVKGTGENVKLKLYDAHGTLILEKATEGLAQINMLDGQSLSSGLYFLELINGDVSNKQRVIVR